MLLLKLAHLTPQLLSAYSPSLFDFSDSCALDCSLLYKARYVIVSVSLDSQDIDGYVVLSFSVEGELVRDLHTSGHYVVDCCPMVL